MILIYLELLLGKAWACVGALGIPWKHLFCLGLWLGFGWDRGRNKQRLYGLRTFQGPFYEVVKDLSRAPCKGVLKLFKGHLEGV